MFFNKKWSDVTDEEIEKMSKKLADEMGGWVFHSKVDFNSPTPHVQLKTSHPKIMKSWIEKNSEN